VRLGKTSRLGEHNVTVPLHNPVAKGTLNDILNKVSLWNGIPKDDLIQSMK